MLRLANVYGQTGGHHDEEASMITDHIIGSIMEELETQPGIPTIIIGDLNAEPQDIPIVAEMLEQDGWVDCGHKANLWGGEVDQGTCMGPNANK